MYSSWKVGGGAEVVETTDMRDCAEDLEPEEDDEVLDSSLRRACDSSLRCWALVAAT